MFKELRGKLGEDTSEKLIDFIQDSQQKRFDERWDQLVTKDYFHQEMTKLREGIHQEMSSFRSEIHKELRTQLRWLLPLLFGQLGILLAMMVKIFLDG